MAKFVGGGHQLVSETFGTIYCGTLTGTNETLSLSGDTYLIGQVLVQADPANDANVRVGNSLEQRITLAPGAPITIPVDKLGIVYVWFPAGGGRVNWLAVG